MTILTSVWSAQHPNACQNIQHLAKESILEHYFDVNYIRIDVINGKIQLLFHFDVIYTQISLYKIDPWSFYVPHDKEWLFPPTIRQ